jgi:hypothetical protein
MPRTKRCIVWQEAGNLVALFPLGEFQIEGKNESTTISNPIPLPTYEIIRMCCALL